MREKSLSSFNPWKADGQIARYQKQEITMNSTNLGRNRTGFKERLRKYRLRRRFRHDRWLVFNMATFNSEGSWNRTFDPLRASATVRCLADVNTARAKRALVYESVEHVDEALWSAYQRSDKGTVTKALLQRCLRPRKPEARRRKLSRG